MDLLDIIIILIVGLLGYSFAGVADLQTSRVIDVMSSGMRIMLTMRMIMMDMMMLMMIR